MTRVMLVDDHPVFREGLRSILHRTEEFTVAMEAGSVEEALTKLAMTEPDVIVTDVRLGQLTGHDLLKQVVKDHPQIPVLVMSMVVNETEVLSAIEAGAAGYLPKLADSNDFLVALREVSQGRSYLHPHVAHVVFAKVRQPMTPAHNGNPAPNLTPRELELLCHLGRGDSPADAAVKMFLSLSTVKTHLRSLFRKLNVSTRTQLVLKAIELGIIKPPGTK